MAHEGHQCQCGEQHGDPRTNQPGRQQHRAAHDGDIGPRYRRQVRHARRAKLAAGFGGDCRGVTENQGGQHRRLIGRQNASNRGDEPAADGVRGPLHRTGPAKGRPARRVEHRDRQVVAGWAADARGEPHRLADHD
jgi:hypothetical protein